MTKKIKKIFFVFQKLHENNLAKEQKLNELYSKTIESDPDFKRSQSMSERAPTNVSLKIELQKKERVKKILKKKIFFYKNYFLGNK